MGYISSIRKKIGNDAIFMPSAGCCIIKNNKILLQKRNDDNKWGIHGGSLELGETFLEALERELKEELNVRPINPKFVDIYSGRDMHYIYPNNDEVYTILMLYLVKEYEGSLKAADDEVSKLKWFDMENIPQNLHEPDIKPIYAAIDFYKKDNC